MVEYTLLHMLCPIPCTRLIMDSYLLRYNFLVVQTVVVVYVFVCVSVKLQYENYTNSFFVKDIPSHVSSFWVHLDLITRTGA